MKKNNAQVNKPKPSPAKPARELKMATVLGQITQNSRNAPKTYVKEWIVPGGGE